jgi:para-aminobenzoate synthetase component 1
MLENSAIFDKMNQLGSQRIPFFFMIDFLKEKGEVIPLSELSDEIQFHIHEKISPKDLEVELTKHPITFTEYETQFRFVQENILRGNSFLTNLTCATPIELNLSLEEIFNYSRAKYKLYYRNHFVCFSPETFVKIEEGKIYSHPMKGTIDASIENAEEIILADQKEKAEHYTIVDLIRNDLSKVAKKVTVDRFRYIEEIQTSEKKLLQVSSEISGELPADYQDQLGTIFEALLPAGSICGAPKEKTVEIILKAESYDRNFYTGVFGVYDGKKVDSAVMIRFIEQNDQGFLFKSGGGITHQSQAKDEYNEMIDKVYVPIN